MKRPGIAALLVLCLIGLSGCSAVADSAVVRRSSGYVARTWCPAGSPPGVASAQLLVDGEVVWQAEVVGGGRVAELPLLVPSEGVKVTVDRSDQLLDGAEVEASIRSFESGPGPVFTWDELAVGQAATARGIVPEAEFEPAGWLSEVGCTVAGRWRETSLIALAFAIFGALSIGVIVLAVLLRRARRGRAD